MINIATEYIENHKLRFNPHKTICHIMGQNPFTTIPRWYFNGVSLDIEDKLTYLGSILGENGGKEHCENHCRTAHHYFLGSRGQELSLLVQTLKQPYICSMWEYLAL